MFQTLFNDDVLVLRFQGSMDTARCAELETEVRRALDEPGQPIAFDLEGVDFVSSSFLRFCVLAKRQAGESGFQILNASPMIKRVFKIAGLDAMLA